MNYWNHKKSNYPSTDYRSRNFSGCWQKHYINMFVDSVYSNSLTKAQSKLSIYKDEHQPECLYKFYSPTAFSLTNLLNQQIHLSDPRNFNDPFDSYTCVERNTFAKKFILKKLKDKKLITKENSIDTISDEEYWSIYHSNSVDEDYSSDTYNLNNKKSFFTTLYSIKKSKSKELERIIFNLEIEATHECKNRIDFVREIPLRITCFSKFNNIYELKKNTTMWSHYADNHKGYCVKYKTNFEQLKFKNAIISGLFPVIYTSRIQKLTPEDLLSINLESTSRYRRSILKKVFKASITKSKFWNYEKEWRLIFWGNDLKFLTNDTIPFLSAEAIYMGCRIDENIEKSIVNFAEKNNIKIFESTQNDERYELNFYPINSEGIKKREYYQMQYKFNSIDDTVLM